MNCLQAKKFSKMRLVSLIAALILIVLFVGTQLTFAQSSQSDAENTVYDLLVNQGILDEQSEETARIFASDIVTEALEEGISLQDAQAILDYAQNFFGTNENSATQIGILNNVSCFDYYSFGSVEVELQSGVVGTVSGSLISFTGTIRNNNSYPIVDGSVYIKVFRFIEDDDNVNGPIVVDQGFVRSGITLPAGGSSPIEFTWEVPSNAVAGKYMLATFFTTSKKFNLSGLSFTDDVTGSTVSFSVDGEQSTEVRFDKDSVIINEVPYFFAAFPPTVGKSEPATVNVSIANTTDVEVAVPVRWRLFFWDAQRREQMIEDFTEQVVVPKNSSVVVEHTVTNAEYPVYLLEASLAYKDTKSFLNMRFVREGMNRGRINFPSVTSYPLLKGEQSGIFSCLNNTSNGSIENGEIRLVLRESTGETIYDETFTGRITGDMLAVAQGFIPKSTYRDFILEAQLFQDGALVDDVSIPYICEDITPGKCKQSEIEQGYLFGEFLSDTLSENQIKIFGSIGALVFLALVGILYRRVSRKEDSF